MRATESAFVDNARHGRLRKLAPEVYVATSDMYMTNTIVVAANDRCLLIDAALLPGELKALENDLAKLHLQVEAAVSTHPHWDHLLWSSGLGNAPRYASPGAVAAVAKDRKTVVEDALAGAGERWYAAWEVDLVGRLTVIPDDQYVPWSGPSAIFITHNGHAPGHSAVYFPELDVLAAGDMLSDVEVPGLDWNQSNQFEEYQAGLDSLAQVRNVELVIPGHGRPGDAQSFKDRIAADRRYLTGLKSGDSDDERLHGWPPMQHQHQANVEGFAKATA